MQVSCPNVMAVSIFRAAKTLMTVSTVILGLEDLVKFPYNKVLNNTLFDGCHLDRK